jgi:hypothetical protein
MRKFLTLTVGFIWLLAQGASAEPREHDGNHGGGRPSGAGQHAQGFNGGERSYHQPGNHSPSMQSNGRSFNRQPSINRARPNAYNPSHFSYVRSSQVAVPGRFRSLGIRSVPQPLTNRSQYVATNRAHSTIPLPSTGPNGQALSAKLVARANIGSSVIQHHMGLISAGVEINRINQYNRAEVRPNYYYWHSYNGFNYCHYYDSWGYHWYGWYLGGSCFWTRYYWGNWWWYDPAWSRWCYWHDGGWWWNDPYNTQVVYVYDSGNYQPIQTDSSTAANPPAPPAVDTSASAGASVSSAPIVQKGAFKSPDGTRLVKIFGDTNDAILSDTANPPKFAAVFLGSNAKSVRYGQASDGSLQVTVTYKDGSVKNFDGNGNSLDGEETTDKGDNT